MKTTPSMVQRMALALSPARHWLLAASLAIGCASSLTPSTAGAAEQTLTVGSTPSGIPFTFLDVETNEITGAMVDLIKAVGEDAGYDIAIQQSQFSSLIPSLRTGKIDVISAAMLKTPERAEVVDFSHDIFPYAEGLVVQGDNGTHYTTLDDLAGEVIGAQVGTTYIEHLNSLGIFAEVRSYNTLADMMHDISLGRITAGIGDEPIIAYQFSQDRFPELKLAEDYQPEMVGQVGFAVKKGNSELLADLNASLTRLKEQGKVDAIFTEWGLK
ncbi:amino acid ABC transporter substrate-binding protein, PAAT family (TC 3.A.1.3.-) [Modicisalibacter muralis]|uniref:Amino acid ABC transporter substrate-binding protein, PAAT family (TC 3.A.1.3.-) n=1 Tax=Modicisalibacter muralis TaxID=119000 RepID=A0A1G9H3I3_9GAMM|nr:ABC transporter substrate-binding protein [Halomonas muralis]SDL07442.1 amino acid ABC transporter substrate-binding protein, PAAT family (TC 3.A.1.3.-) [Halomonas muralis]